MARRPRAFRLESRSNRLRFPVREKPYDFTTISPGISIGYRRTAPQASGLSASPTVEAAIGPSASPSPTISRNPTASRS